MRAVQTPTTGAVATEVTSDQVFIETSIPTLTTTKTQTPTPDIQTVITNRAGQIVQALHDKDMAKLARYVHPDIGLRFSPYAYVLGTHALFTASQTANLLSDLTIYNWGNEAGSGFPIQMTFTDYYARYVFDHDYTTAPYISFDSTFSKSNMINNIEDFFTQNHVVEFHFPGFDPQYEGLDWRSLRLVFQEKDGSWYLVAIIHDEWTP
jgi:hypothetical protein